MSVPETKAVPLSRKTPHALLGQQWMTPSSLGSLVHRAPLADQLGKDSLTTAISSDTALISSVATHPYREKKQKSADSPFSRRNVKTNSEVPNLEKQNSEEQNVEPLVLLLQSQDGAVSQARDGKPGEGGLGALGLSQERSNLGGSASPTDHHERVTYLHELEQFLLQRAGRHEAREVRYRTVRKALPLVSRLYPPLTAIMSSIERYVDDCATLLNNLEENHRKDLRTQEHELYAKFEEFFEEKIKGILIEKRKAEMRAEEEHAIAQALRLDRDSDLTAVKEDLIQRLNDCEHTEDEFRGFRHLIAAVFQTNQQLMGRIEQLEALLARHRIEIPEASAELMTYNTSSEGRNGGPRDSSAQRNQSTNFTDKVSVEFVEASRRELALSRLKLQEELLHSAFDERSAYRMQIKGLQKTNDTLTFKVSDMEERIRDLYVYIHEKRFIRTVDTDGHEMEALTPRPREVPLALQTELGIELRHSTAEIVIELAAVALNMKHQLNSALLRVRQMNALSSWITESVTEEIVTEAKNTAAIAVCPVSQWTSIPHFLRTDVAPDVANLSWTQIQVGCIFQNFFSHFKDLRAQCRFVRDEKMLAPRTYQLFEHRGVLLVRLDATKEEVTESEENVPFGYVVSHFIRLVMTSIGRQTAQPMLTLLLPGTVNTFFTVNGDDKVSELDFAQFAYNMWWYAQQFRHVEPLCQLFLHIVDGVLPVELFDRMELVIQRVAQHLDHIDVNGSHFFTYNKVVKGLLRLISDLDAQATLQGVQAIAKTFEANGIPLHGGMVPQISLTADETYCAYEPTPVTFSSVPPLLTSDMRYTVGGTPSIAVPPTETKGDTNNQKMMETLQTQFVPILNPPMPLGASNFLHYWRRLVLQEYERTYNALEVVLAPLVEESQVVLGLYLLSVPAALERVQELDEASVAESRSNANGASHFDMLSDNTIAGAELTAEAAELLGIPGVTRSYVTLLKSRRAVVKERNVVARDLWLRTIKDAITVLPTFHSSTHFPFRHVRRDPDLASDGMTTDDKEASTVTLGTTTTLATATTVTSVGSNARQEKGPGSSTTFTRKNKTEGGGRAKKRKKVNKGASSTHSDEKKDALLRQLDSKKESELVEWYSLRRQLRSRLPHISGKLFDPPPPPKDAKGVSVTDANLLDMVHVSGSEASRPASAAQ